MRDKVRTRISDPASWIRTFRQSTTLEKKRIETLLEEESRPLSPDAFEKVLANHNRNIVSNASAGDIRLGPDRTPTTALVQYPTGEIVRFDLFYNVRGHLDGRSLDKIRSGKINSLESINFSPSLSRFQRQRIQSISNNSEKQYLYSTAAIPLALCRTLRQQLKTNLQIEFKDLLPDFSQRAAPLLRTYNGGTCLTIAEEVATRVKSQTGCNAYVVSTNPENNVLTAWASMVDKKTKPFGGAYELMGQDTHTNVVVPYLKGSQRRYLRIDTGVGPNNIIIRDWTDKDFDEMEHEFIINNPAALAALSARCLGKIHIKNYKTNSTFALDIFRGHMYLNKNIHTTSALPDDANSVDLFSPVMPREEIEERSFLILESLIELFALDHEVISDIRFLIDNRQQYIDQVLISPATCLSQCIHDADKAVERIKKAENELLQSPHDADLDKQIEEMKNKMDDAAKLVFANKSSEAQKLYRMI